MSERSSENEHWEVFPRAMKDYQAFVFVDVGIAERVVDAPRALAQLRLAYESPSPNGLPTRAEFDPVNAIEDKITDFSNETGDEYVGRITVAGIRVFYVYTEKDEAAWRSFTSAIAAETGYDIRLSYRYDPDHRGYFDDLYPTQIDWQVISDLRVIEALESHGDDGSAPRKIEHWAYFDSQESAATFVAWAKGEGLKPDRENSHQTEDGRYCVRLFHHGTVKLEDINHYTVALKHKAAEYGGEYDGWETMVLKSEARE